MHRSNYNSTETVATELLFQSMLGTDIQRQKANMKLSRQGLPGSLRLRCRHRGVEIRSKLGSTAGWWQRQREAEYARMKSSLDKFAVADQSDFSRRQSSDPFAGLPSGWNVLHNANDLLQGADYASGAIGGAQIGAIRYRQSLPVSSRVIPFSKFAQGYRWMGKLGRGLGRAGAAGVLLGTGLDLYALQQGQLSTGRFIYRTTGTASSIITSIYVGAMFGGPYGAAAGLVVGLAFVGGEIAYDQVSRLVDELTEGIADLERALRQGWMPSF